MGRVSTAFRLFFKALGDGQFAARAASLLQGEPLTAAPVPAPRPLQAPLPQPARSEALTLLSLLQREGRLIDFLKENISGYSDAQVGAAVRDIHRDCAAVLDRIFAIAPLRSESEGAPIEVPRDFDASAIRLTGNVSGQPPFRGALRHHGWRATKSDLPAYTGPATASSVIAPAEIEV